MVTGELKLKIQQLDVLVNNVGFLSSRKKVTKDGFEKVFFINRLLPFYLTHQLLPLLESAGGRIVNITGGVYSMGTINFDDLELDHAKFKPLKAIANAKLALVMSSLVWAEKLADRKVAVFISDPGVAKSGMGQQNHAWPWWFRS